MKIASRPQFWILLLSLVVMSGAPVAFADTLDFDLSVPNAALVGFPAPYVHVSVNRTSNTVAIVTFTSLNSPGGIYTYGMGGNGLVGLNVNAASFTLTGITENGTGTASVQNPPVWEL
jgi:hypothetical protein